MEKGKKRVETNPYISCFVPMKGIPKHERRWASDSVPGKATVSTGTSPGTESNSAAEEFVEVTLDLREDDTIVLRSVEPASVINVDDGVAGSGYDTPASVPRSPTIRRTSSRGLRQFSQELKAEAVAKARQFSHELKAELRRFSWSHGQASRTLSSSSAQNGTGGGAGGGVETALAARALRKQRAQLDRTRSGAHKALRGLRFISSKSNGVDAWNEVQSNFDRLAKDGFLHRADFGQCIGPFLFLKSQFIIILLLHCSFKSFDSLSVNFIIYGLEIV